MAVTIAVVAEKGGVGKTTTTVSLAAAYAASGLKTVLIDMDPQASLTRGLIGSVWTDRLRAEATVAALFGVEVVPAARLIQATAFGSLSLLPGSRAMKAMNRLEPAEYGMRLYALRELVEELDGYERVLIDNPPNLEFCTMASLAAADYALTPLQAEDYGAQGVQFVQEAVDQVRASANPRLVMLGLLRTMYQQRAAIHIAYTETLRRDFPGLLLESFIPHAAQFREAVMARTPIGFYKPRGANAKAVAAVAAEIEGRISKLRQPAAAVNREVI